jgi:hypothetical protein
VRDDHRARAQAVEEPLEPCEAVEVEVVRRLVEQEDVEAREHDPRERRAGRLAAGHPGDRLVEAREADLGRDCAGARVEVGAPEREEPVERVGVVVREVRLGLEPRRERVHLPFGCVHARAPSEVVAQRLAGACVGLLREVADASGADDAPAVRLLEAGEDAQEGRLADPVRADHAHAVAGRDDQRHAPQHLGGAEALRYLVCCQGPRHGRTSSSRKA